MKLGNLGQLYDNWYFVNNCLIEVRICDTYCCDYLPHTMFRFYSIEFQLNADFPSQVYGGFFIVKSPCVTQRSVSQQNVVKKAKPVGFSLQNYRLQ